MGTNDSSWTRALMASSGISLSHDSAPKHASPAWQEASDADTPLFRLQKLATSREREVRTVIARRPDCPMGILAALAFDHDGDIRVAVAGNPRITSAIALHLAKDRNPDVVKALARNHEIDLALLQDLATHKKEGVRRVASRNLDERARGVGAGMHTHDLSGDMSESPLGARSNMPLELRDRVQERPGGLAAALRADSSHEAGTRPSTAGPILPRLHPS